MAYYSVYQLKRFDEWTAYLYLLCFVSYRYRRFHDNLIGSLLYHVRGFADEAKEEARQRVYEQQAESGQNLQKAGQVLKLFTDDGIGDGVPFREARAQAFGILEREKLASVADRIAAKTGFDEAAYEWEHIDGMAKRFKGQLRPVLQAVAFEAVSAQDPLLEAAAFLKEAFRKGKPLSQCPPEAFPVGFVPESAKRYLYAQDERGHKRLLPDRYEFLVYRQLRQGVDAIDISCRDLVNYQTGRIDFTTALDAQRQIRQAWLDYLKAQVEQQIRLAEIERLVGAPL